MRYKSAPQMTPKPHTPHASIVVPGIFAKVLQALFTHEEGHLRFGPARSKGRAASCEAVTDWLVFDDYIMEGGVRYALRARPHPEGLALDVALAGTVRDRFVLEFVAMYVRWAGLTPIMPTGERGNDA
jgi:hypothetical protein